MGRQRIELFGATFGRLTITRYVGPAKRNTWWEARCACGRKTYVTTQALRRKSRPLKSCGCLCGEHMKHRLATPWGSMFRQSLYMQWKRIRKEDPQQLCEAWRAAYIECGNWCLANGWTPDKRMVRIDAYLPWGPENVLLVPMRRRQQRRHADVVLAA